MKVVGEAELEVSYADQGPKTLTLTIAAGNGPPLLGRNCIQHFVLEWPKIKSILLANESLRRLLQDYADVFQDGLGTITPFKAALSVSPSANPRFHRPRPVMYALRPLVEQELERLERAGVLQPVNHSDWAAPIVTVPKRDGAVLICGDYKTTVNPVLDVDQYPLPRPDDLFATLAGGRYIFLHNGSVSRLQPVTTQDQYPPWTVSVHKATFRSSLSSVTLSEDDGYDSTRNGLGDMLSRR